MDREKITKAIDVLFDEICFGNDCDKCPLEVSCGCLITRLEIAITDDMSAVNWCAQRDLKNKDGEGGDLEW